MKPDLRAILICLWPGILTAQQDTRDDWTIRKCALYAAAWQDVKKTHDLTAASAGFLARHQVFIDLGCPEGMRVCAVTPRDIEFADLMTILSVNEGMAGTFVPFGCPQ